MASRAYSVRISERTHRALSELKRSTGQSMLAIIELAVDRWQRELLLGEANAAWAAILADPAARAEIVAERELWETTSADGLDQEVWREGADLGTR